MDWRREHALLALRLNRLLTGGVTGTALIYEGPEAWRELVAGEPPASAGALEEEAARLLESAPDAYLAAQVRAMRAAARYVGGERAPLAEYARECLGLEPRWVPEEVFGRAHDELDRALPGTRGSLAERWRAWQAAYRLDPVELLPQLVELAVAETRARTNARIVPLPPDEVVQCRLVSGVAFHGAGAYEGGHRSTIHINTDIPFNLADLLYLVAHEGHPGHIAESMLKGEEVRFMLSPSFVLSEGLGLVAEELLFPENEARDWLNAIALPMAGLPPIDGDLAAVHHAKNVLWGVWGNVAFMAAEGRGEAELTAYLRRWALVTEEEAKGALGILQPSPMSPYIFGYFHGWELVRRWATGPERTRRLLTERLLPTALT
ncbi:hypothetical protein AB0K12_13420 [Nonomuraea sp. NPDC049419]|uniref:hypothetical protein n=1 Tax=Nonomuraea sp. NPDC049419 TaxID=3155772 RepID=UPI003439DF8B